MLLQKIIENWLLVFIQFGCLAVLFVIVFFKQKKESFFLWCLGATLGFFGLRVAYVAVRTGYQHYVWSTNEVTARFLTYPVEPASLPLAGFFNYISGGPGYLLFYSYGRYWLSAILTVAVAASLLLVLFLMRKFMTKTIGPGISASEVWVLTAATVIVGWPQFLVMLIFTAVFSVIFYIIFRKNKPHLEWPIMLATLVTLIFGAFFVQLFGISVLNI